MISDSPLLAKKGSLARACTAASKKAVTKAKAKGGAASTTSITVLSPVRKKQINAKAAAVKTDVKKRSMTAKCLKPRASHKAERQAKAEGKSPDAQKEAARVAFGQEAARCLKEGIKRGFAVCAI